MTVFTQYVQRKLLFVIVLSISFFLLSCSPSIGNAACIQRQTYGYRFVDLSEKIQRTTPLTLTWKAVPDPSPTVCQTTPSIIVINAKLYGPYRTSPGGTPSTSAPLVAQFSLQSNVWTNQTYTKTFPPNKLLPGYYVLVHSEVVQNAGSTQSNAIFQVVS